MIPEFPYQFHPSEALQNQVSAEPRVPVGCPNPSGRSLMAREEGKLVRAQRASADFLRRSRGAASPKPLKGDIAEFPDRPRHAPARFPAAREDRGFARCRELRRGAHSPAYVRIEDIGGGELDKALGRVAIRGK